MQLQLINIAIHDLTTQSMRAQARAGPQWQQMASSLDTIKDGLLEAVSAFGSWVPQAPPPGPEASHWSSQASTSFQFGSTSHCPDVGAAATGAHDKPFLLRCTVIIYNCVTFRSHLFTGYCPVRSILEAGHVAGVDPSGFPGTQHSTGFGDVPLQFTQPPWSEPSASQPGTN
jgi:hypothetical protein